VILHTISDNSADKLDVFAYPPPHTYTYPSISGPPFACVYIQTQKLLLQAVLEGPVASGFIGGGPC